MIDIESILLAEQKQNQALAVEQIRDASSKWIAKLPKWMAQTHYMHFLFRAIYLNNFSCKPRTK